MKKLLILFIISIVSLYGAKYETIEYTIGSDITKLKADVPNNHSGIVVKQLGKNSSIIAIARANNGMIDYLPSELLMQENLPKVIESVSSGDKIIFNYLYNNAVIIAPNAEAYKTVEEKNKGVTFIDIDTFSGYLTRETQPVPAKKEFLNYAKEYDIGLFYIALDGRLYIVDARTFDVIESRNFRVALDEPQQPFYSKVKQIKESFWSWFTSKESIGNYNTYYKSLLGVE